MIWGLSWKEVFNVMSFHNVLCARVWDLKTYLEEQGPLEWTSLVLWLQENVSKGGIVDSLWLTCAACARRTRSSGNHLLLHCEVPDVLWNMAFGLFENDWVLPARVLNCWREQFASHQCTLFWRMIFLLLIVWYLARKKWVELWRVWKEGDGAQVIFP